MSLPFHLPLDGEHLSRVICIAAVAALHLLLCFLVFDIDVTEIIPDPPVTVMKLTDIQEYTPPPPPPVTQPAQNTSEAVAEEVIEVEELETAVEESVPFETENNTTADTGPDYLPAHKISVLPEFDEKKIQNRTVYPPIAQRSGIEGLVYLELFIDREGYVRNITVLKETPEGRGFAEAAVKAFEGMKAAHPAQANGENVAARYRRPVRFKLG